MHDNTLLLLSGICFVGIACQWVAWRLKQPAIIFLLLAGILSGPVFGILDPDALFGELFFPIVSLGVAIILFEGGLTLKLSDVSETKKVLFSLLTVGVLVTWVVTAVAAKYLIGFSWELAFLFGSFMTVTGPTVIKPLIRTIRPKAEIAHILHWEGIFLDSIGAILTVLVFQYIVSEQLGQGIVTTLLSMVFTGVSIGVACAWLLGFMLRRYLIPLYLQHVFSLSLVLIAFSVSNHIQHESGLVAVTIMGMVLANMKNVDIEELLFFKESLSVMAISVLFILLAARIDLNALLSIGVPALILLAVIMFVVRPVSIFVSTIGSNLSLQSKTLLSWVAPRGIVAAAVSALFALRLEDLGYAGADILVTITFLVIIGTVLIQGLTSRPIAKWLGLVQPEPEGIFIVGANHISQLLALEIKKQGVKVMLSDTGWENVTSARLKGIDTYYGNVVSDHADRIINLQGLGKLLAMTSNNSLNSLALTRYKAEFGLDNIFYTQVQSEVKSGDHKSVHLSYSGRRAFGKEIYYSDLDKQISSGQKIRTTSISDKFSYADYLELYKDTVTPLVAISDKNKTFIFNDNQQFEVKSGWRVISLLANQEEVQA
jgi:NhaP-type Na+/H+ or K+/H+ antiporter